MTDTTRAATWAIRLSVLTTLVCIGFAILVVARRAILGPALSTQTPSLLTANHAAAVGFTSVYVAIVLRLLCLRWPRSIWLTRAAVGLGVIAVALGLAAMLNGISPAYHVVRRLAVWHDTELDLIAPNAGLIMVLGGLTVALLDWQPRWGGWPAQWFAVANAVLGSIGLVGYAYNIGILYRLGNTVPMAISSALGAVYMSLAALCSRPDRGMCRLFLSRGTGGQLARRLIPPAILVPVLPGWLAIFGVQRRWFGVPSGTALVVVVGILGFAALIWWTAIRVERVDQLRRRGTALLSEQYHLAEEARSRARALLDSTADGMLLLGTGGDVLTANRQFVSLFGLDPTFVSAPSFQALQRAITEDLAGGTQLWEDMAAPPGAARPVGARTVTQMSPSRRDLEVQALPVRRDDGSVLGHLWTFRNVTSEREVNRLRSEFVSYVSHELRTPLTSIKGFLDIYLEDYASALTPDQRETLDIVDANAQRLIRLINELLEVNSVEGGGISLRLAPTDIGNLGRQAGASFQAQVAAKEQQLVLDIPDALPAVSADAERVSQIIVNLLTNAHQYTLAGGRITLEMREEPGWLHVAVRDTGIGMTREDQGRLFTRFFRAKDAAVQATRGTGLGLVVTRALVELHGGRLQVQSVKGIGSTFRFTLPVAPGSPPEGNPNHPGGPV